MKTLLVTGATGFLGRHLVEKLLARKAAGEDLTVRLLVRTKTPELEAREVEIVEGDIRDRRGVERAVAGVAGIFHLAGLVSRNPKNAPLLFETHIEGTRNMCEAALAAGKPKIVLASSSGTVAASRQPEMHNEDSPYIVELAGRWPYYLSKIYQEKLAFSYFHRQGLPVVAVNPSLLLGPGDERLSSTGDVRLFLEGGFPNAPGGGLNFIDVRDAAEATLAAMDKGRPGQRYLLGGHNMTISEFFGLLSRVSGARAPRLQLPESWSRAGAAALRRLYRLAGKAYPLHDATIEMGYRFWYFTSERAQRDLGLAPRAAEATLRDTVVYLRRQNPRLRER